MSFVVLKYLLNEGDTPWLHSILSLAYLHAISGTIKDSDRGAGNLSKLELDP